MKNIFTTLTFLAIALAAFAQQQGFNYQASIRNSTGAPIANSNIKVKFSILDGSASGSVLYSETHQTTSSNEGLFSSTVGTGTSLSGNFLTIAWGSGPKFLKVEIDPAGGNSFVDFGTTQLQSVPFALFAQASAETQNLSQVLTRGADATNQKITGVGDPTNDQDAATKKYVDTKVASHVDGDFDKTNEIQDLQLSGGTLKLTNNASATEINLGPFLGTNTDDQDLSLDAATNMLSLTNDATPVDLTPYLGWSKSGNNISDPATEFLGTKNAQPLSFRTNNAERMKISAEGNIGVGTDPTTEKFHLLAPTILSNTSLTYLNSATARYIGSVFEFESAPVNAFQFGLVSKMTGTTGSNHAMFGISEGVNSTYNTGVLGYATNSSNDNTGVAGVAKGNNTQNYALWGTASGSGSTNVGARVEASGGDYNYAVSAFSQTGSRKYAFNGYVQGGGILNIGAQTSVLSATATDNRGFSTTVDGAGDAGVTTSNYGVYAMVKNNARANYGIFAFTEGSSDTYNVGVRGSATGSSGYNAGGRFTASGTNQNNYGVFAGASGGSLNMAGYFTATISTTGTNYGIYATASGGANNYAGYFNGNVQVTEKISVDKILRLAPQSSAPVSPQKGDIYYDETSDTLKLWNGSAWKTISML